MSRHFIPTLLSVRMEGWRSLTSVTTRLLPCVFRLVKSRLLLLTSDLSAGFFCCFCGFLAAPVRPPSFSNFILSVNFLLPSFLLSFHPSSLPTLYLVFPFLPPDSFIPLFLFIQQELFLMPFLVILSSFLLPYLSFTTHTGTHTYTDTPTGTHRHTHRPCVSVCVSGVCRGQSKHLFVQRSISARPASSITNRGGRRVGG